MKQNVLMVAALFLMAGSAAAWAFQAKVVDVKEHVTKPVLVEKTDPQYPEEARKGKVQGAVKLDATIGTDGRVVDLKIAESPDDSLSKAAMDAVKNWKFKPAVNSKGKPIKVKMTLTVNFRLQ
jgi:protein TonB